LDPVFKPFGTTPKKEMRNEVETSEKYGVMEREKGIRKWGKSPRSTGKGPKNFEFFLEKV